MATDSNEIPSDIQAAIDAGMHAADISSRMHTVLTDQGELPIVLLNRKDGQEVRQLPGVLRTIERMGDAPNRQRGTSQHQELQSFLDCVQRFKAMHGENRTVIWADLDKVQLTALFNYASQDNPGWGDHRAVYACPLTPQWKRWIGSNEKWADQATFASFIEDARQDLVTAPPSWEDAAEYVKPADVVKAIRTLSIHTSTRFKSEINRDTGETTLFFGETHETADVARVPRSFALGIPIFQGGETYALKVRVRFARKDDKVVFQYAIQAPEVYLRDAFAAVRKIVSETTGVPLFCGTPEVLPLSPDRDE